MSNFKKLFSLILALMMVLSCFAGCNKDGGDDEGAATKVVGDNVAVEDLAGITGDTIYVGNTAGTTGALSSIGEPFNLGIQAAFAAYNADGGYKGLKVALKHYDDGGDATQAVTLMNQLVFDDEVFAVVGNFGSYAVASNLDILIDEGVPMVYAAAGNDILFNEKAEGNDKAIFPVQPLNHTEGQILILRAFAPADKGGMAAVKVGVLSNNDEASQSMLAGVKAEAETSNLSSKIVYQNVAGDDYSGAINAFKDAGCDVIVCLVTGNYFTTALKAMANANLYCKVLTSYNNASAAVFNDATTTLLASEYEAVFNTVAIYAQGWLDISSTTYVFDAEAATPLGQAYKALYESMSMEYTGVVNFNETYWDVACDIYNYAVSQGRADALVMSYDSFALAGYIAGNLFCQGLEALEASGEALTRENYIAIMESKEYQIAMADAISFADGLRSGVTSFSLTQIFDYYAYGAQYHQAASATVYPLTSIAEYRELLKG